MEDIDVALRSKRNRQRSPAKPKEDSDSDEDEDEDNDSDDDNSSGSRVTLSGLLNAIDGIAGSEGRVCEWRCGLNQITRPNNETSLTVNAQCL
jgi:mitochondrial chaperone BCS1